MQETRGLPKAETAARPLRVFVTHGPDAGQSARVDRELVIGSSTLGDLVLSDSSVSRRHCTLEPRGSNVLVRDRGSKNGILACGMRILEAELAAGTELRIGETTLKIDVDRHATGSRGEHAATAETHFGRFVGRAECLRAVYRMAARAAENTATVLLEGESGTGKELLAEAIHEKSTRAAEPFVVVDCGAIPESLIESELFGHEKGAFTGANQARKGAFETAHRGTLFLDEIGELPLPMQAKLQGVLDRLQFRRVGGDRTIEVDVRIIAATNRNLEREVEEQRFRLDLFHRLAVCLIRVPPLRERLDDLRELVRCFAAAASSPIDPEFPGAELLARLANHPWPGNVRELRNYVERLIIFGDSSLLRAPPAASSPSAKAMVDRALESILTAAVSGMPYRQARAAAVDRFTELYVEAMLERHGTPTLAAKAAGVARRHFHRLKQR